MIKSLLTKQQTKGDSDVKNRKIYSLLLTPIWGDMFFMFSCSKNIS